KVGFKDKNETKLGEQIKARRSLALQDIRRSHATRFPGARDWYSPVHAASQQSADTKFMLGILISGDRVLITTSGGGVNTNAFTFAARFKSYDICNERDRA